MKTGAARDPWTSHQGTESCGKRTQRGQRGTSETSAERDQWRELPDERARREPKLRVTPGTSGAKEFEDGRKLQAALRRSCPLRR